MPEALLIVLLTFVTFGAVATVISLVIDALSSDTRAQ